MFKTLANAWKIPDLKKKIVFTLIILLLYRLGSNIPVPFVNAFALQQTLGALSGSIFDMLSGSGFTQAHLFALSISPYITAQIVIQLLTVAIPALERLSKEGEEGRRKINKITHILTVVLGFITAYGYYALLRSNNLLTNNGTFAMWVMIACYCAGASLVMWMADRINEFGIGNGVSLFLFVNILSSGYQTAATLFNQVATGHPLKIFFAVLSVVIMLGVLLLIVFITNSERRIPVQYAKRVVGRKMYGGQSSNLPLKVNMSGVMPVIFASSIVSLPSTIGMFTNPKGFWLDFVNFFAPGTWVYAVLELVLIVAFSYFYISISFNTVEVSNNLKKNGGFVPGIRPGRPTADYIKNALNRVTLVGALFLVIIAGLPMFVGMFATTQELLGILTFGGTSLLIVVGVALETIRELESQMAMRHYKGFLGD
ncbi:MAG: preprotein translocase subunit SecY [Clostridia bacterium]|nr:preprotein translocase subunit SecY [Clostridia bacterium]